MLARPETGLPVYADQHLQRPFKQYILAKEEFYKTSITALKIDASGTLWVNTFWSYYPRSTKSRYESFYYNISNSALTQFTAARVTNYDYAVGWENTVWLLREDIFSMRLGNTFEQISVDRPNPFGFKARQMFCLLEDKDRNRWIGTDEGLFIFNRLATKWGVLKLLTKAKSLFPQHGSNTWSCRTATFGWQHGVMA
jgi:ligand-binding sensor domain-containing protein